MNWKDEIQSAVSQPLDSEVLDELAQHAAATYASARAEGCDTAEANRRVEQQIAAWAAHPSHLRRRPRREAAVEPPPSFAEAAEGKSGSASGFSSVLKDVRYAWRLLRKQPAYTVLVLTTMALGIAATTVVGSVAYGVLLKPLPWADAPRLVRLYETREGSTRRLRPMMTNASYRAWREQATTLDGLGAWSAERVTMAGAAGLPRLSIAAVTPSLFPMLQAAPALGRTVVDGDDDRGGIAILSHAMWQQAFGGRSDIVGQTVRFDTTTYTIVGVMPASFAFPDRDTAAWIPFRVSPVTEPGREGFLISMFQAVGRRRPGVTPAQAAAEGTARGRTIGNIGPVAMAVFGSNGPAIVSAVPMLDALTGDVKPAILILLAAVALLLVTATANVAGLQLARATARRREFAIRAALGAGRRRLVRQTIVENLLLGLLGGAAGLVLAALMHRALPALLPSDFPRTADLAFDLRIQAFAIAVSLAAGLGCGLLPAIQTSRRNVVPALVEGGLAPIGGGLRTGTARTRALLMAGQMAIAVVLLVGAALLTRTFVRLLHANVGYDPSNVLSARLVLSDAEFTPERRLQVLDDIVARLQGMNGVSRAAYATAAPLAGTTSLSSFPLKKRDGSTQQIQTGSRQVSPGYFAALGQRVLEGREFTDRDGAADAAVIVNREFSRRYLDGRAFGWTLPGSSSRSTPGRPRADRPIVGVVEDTVRQTVTDTPEPEMYFVARQLPLLYENVSFVVRTSGDPRAIVPSLRSVVQAAAPGAPLESVMTMEDRVAGTLSRPRLYAVLLGTFAAFALAIAGVGLFGVLSYSVALRRREIGVRAALGAQSADIVRLVVRQAVAIAAVGLTGGLLAAFWLTSALRTFLYGVTPHDWLSFAAVAALLLVVAVVASIVPARRAAMVDPVTVLRS